MGHRGEKCSSSLNSVESRDVVGMIGSSHPSPILVAGILCISSLMKSLHERSVLLS